MNTIYIGMGTCGLAVGAAKVRDAVGKSRSPPPAAWATAWPSRSWTW